MINYRLLPLVSRQPGSWDKKSPNNLSFLYKSSLSRLPTKNKYKYKYWSFLSPYFCGIASVDLNELGLIRCKYAMLFCQKQ